MNNRTFVLTGAWPRRGGGAGHSDLPGRPLPGGLGRRRAERAGVERDRRPDKRNSWPQAPRWA